MDCQNSALSSVATERRPLAICWCYSTHACRYSVERWVVAPVSPSTGRHLRLLATLLLSTYYDLLSFDADSHSRLFGLPLQLGILLCGCQFGHYFFFLGLLLYFLADTPPSSGFAPNFANSGETVNFVPVFG